MLTCVACLFSSTRATADEARRILVLLEQTKPAFLSRLRAELGSSGFAVAVVTPSDFPPSRSEIEQLARDEHATLVLLLVEAGAGVEFWVVDPSTGKSTFREVILGFYDPHEAPEVVAIRVVETLRATLMDLEHTRASRSYVATRPLAAPEVDFSTKPRPSRFTLGVGGGAAYSTGGVGVMPHLDLSLAWAASSRFRIAVDGALTPSRSKLRGPEGEANVAWYLAGASLGFSATDPAAPIRFRSGVGAWFAVMSLSGQAFAPYVNTHAEFMSVIPHVDAALRFSLTERLGITFGVSAGVSAPAASIHFADRQVATWGRPLWFGNVSLETPLD